MGERGESLGRVASGHLPGVATFVVRASMGKPRGATALSPILVGLGSALTGVTVMGVTP